MLSVYDGCKAKNVLDTDQDGGSGLLGAANKSFFTLHLWGGKHSCLLFSSEPHWTDTDLPVALSDLWKYHSILAVHEVPLTTTL